MLVFATHKTQASPAMALAKGRLSVAMCAHFGNIILIICGSILDDSSSKRCISSIAKADKTSAFH